MASVKDMAIELESNQEMAAALGNPAAAYRLGMLEACRLITDLQASEVRAGKFGEADALNKAWVWVFDAARCLRDMA